MIMSDQRKGDLERMTYIDTITYKDDKHKSKREKTMDTIYKSP